MKRTRKSSAIKPNAANPPPVLSEEYFQQATLQGSSLRIRHFRTLRSIGRTELSNQSKLERYPSESSEFKENNRAFYAAKPKQDANTKLVTHVNPENYPGVLAPGMLSENLCHVATNRGLLSGRFYLTKSNQDISPSDRSPASGRSGGSCSGSRSYKGLAYPGLKKELENRALQAYFTEVGISNPVQNALLHSAKNRNNNNKKSISKSRILLNNYGISKQQKTITNNYRREVPKDPQCSHSSNNKYQNHRTLSRVSGNKNESSPKLFSGINKNNNNDKQFTKSVPNIVKLSFTRPVQQKQDERRASIQSKMTPIQKKNSNSTQSTNHYFAMDHTSSQQLPNENNMQAKYSIISNTSTTFNSKKRKDSQSIKPQTVTIQEEKQKTDELRKSDLSNVFQDAQLYVRVSNLHSKCQPQSFNAMQHQQYYPSTIQNQPIGQSQKDSPLKSCQAFDLNLSNFEGLLNVQSYFMADSSVPIPLSKKLSQITQLKSKISHQVNQKNIIRKIEAHLTTLDLITAYIYNPDKCEVSPSYELLCNDLNSFHYNERVKVQAALLGDLSSCFKLRNFQIGDFELRQYLRADGIQKITKNVSMENNMIKEIDSDIALGYNCQRARGFSDVSSGIKLLRQEFEFCQERLKQEANAEKIQKLKKRVVDSMLIAFLHTELSANGKRAQYFSESSCTFLGYKQFTERWMDLFECITSK